MKKSKITIFLICLFLVSTGVSTVHSQVRNKLPKKALLGAVSNALQDTTGSKIKPFRCKPNTSSITVRVTNLSLPEERPYLITADSLGVTLEIFRGDEHVFNEFYEYRGSNFNKIIAKANSAKLKKVKQHGFLLSGGNSTTLSFNNKKGAYFSLSDNSGLMDYEGDFDGIITEITRQIPNFQDIICKDYSNSSIDINEDYLR